MSKPAADRPCLDLAQLWPNWSALSHGKHARLSWAGTLFQATVHINRDPESNDWRMEIDVYPHAGGESVLSIARLKIKPRSAASSWSAHCPECELTCRMLYVDTENFEVACRHCLPVPSGGTDDSRRTLKARQDPIKFKESRKDAASDVAQYHTAKALLKAITSAPIVRKRHRLKEEG